MPTRAPYLPPRASLALPLQTTERHTFESHSRSEYEYEDELGAVAKQAAASDYYDSYVYEDTPSAKGKVRVKRRSKKKRSSSKASGAASRDTYEYEYVEEEVKGEQGFEPNPPPGAKKSAASFVPDGTAPAPAPAEDRPRS